MTPSFKAVFLSYASEDSAAARRLATALRDAGVEVWFDQAELRGGDAWDRQIRGQIRECRLFLPLISQQTEARPEGYFRREWKLAVERTHDLSERVTFLLPIVIDSTPEATADVPEAFRAVQWTRLPNGEPTAAFVERTVSLIEGSAPRSAAGAPGAPAREAASTAPSLVSTRRSPPRLLAMAALALVVVGGAYAGWRYRQSAPVSAGPAGAAQGPSTSAPTTSVPTTPAAASPAITDQSVAVLPFVDLSEGHDQEYFSDGMAESVIDLLVKIPGLRVPARTSSFYFKGRTVRIQDIGQELGVANVLEGTVRRQGDRLRVTAQLVQAKTGYSLWSATYDRLVRDVFSTQDEIAAAVVKELRVSLLAPAPSSNAPTRSNEAYDLYLQARSLASTVSTANMVRAYQNLKKAVALDPDFALAWAELARVVSNDTWDLTRVYGPDPSESQLKDWLKIWAVARAEAHQAADRALQLAPASAEAHFAKGVVLTWLDRDWPAAQAELENARRLAPDDARIMVAAAELLIMVGRLDEGTALARRAESLDPVGKASALLGWSALAAGDLAAAESAARRMVSLYPSEERVHFHLGCILLLRGDAQAALDAFRAAPPTAPFFLVGPPLALDALGRHAEAEQAMAVAEARYGVDMAYQIAYFYARRHDTAKAVEWLNRAYRQRDGGLAFTKVDPMWRELRGNPAFDALLQTLRLAPYAVAW